MGKAEFVRTFVHTGMVLEATVVPWLIWVIAPNRACAIEKSFPGALLQRSAGVAGGTLLPLDREHAQARCIGQIEC